MNNGLETKFLCVPASFAIGSYLDGWQVVWCQYPGGVWWLADSMTLNQKFIYELAESNLCFDCTGHGTFLDVPSSTKPTVGVHKAAFAFGTNTPARARPTRRLAKAGIHRLPCQRWPARRHYRQQFSDSRRCLCLEVPAQSYPRGRWPEIRSEACNLFVAHCRIRGPQRCCRKCPSTVCRYRQTRYLPRCKRR